MSSYQPLKTVGRTIDVLTAINKSEFSTIA